MHRRLGRNNTMVAKYTIGQKVTITPVKNQQAIPRGCTIESFAGQTGEIVDYHWINLPAGEVFIYTVRIETTDKEVVLHEDELEVCLP